MKIDSNSSDVTVVNDAIGSDTNNDTNIYNENETYENKYPVLSYESISEVFSYIHHHYQYIITKKGLDAILRGNSSIDSLIRPVKLSIYAIFNARLIDDFKDVLLGQSFRERIWSIVKSSRALDDMVPWLHANRCPYMYDDETKKTANEYGIYRFANGDVYEGGWKDGKKYGIGKYTWVSGAIYKGGWSDNKKDGPGTYTWPDGNVYEGGYKNSKKDQGKYTWANGNVYEGGWKGNK